MANKLQFLPLICFVLFPTTFIITYTIAVSYEHINPVFAYISDTGTLSPESCWFALLLSLTGVALGAMVYVRYKQIEVYFYGKKVWTHRLNVATLLIGLGAALGVMIVATFQQTNTMAIHMVGAFLSFLGGSIYFTIQAYFTFKMLPMFTNTAIAMIRLFIGVTCIVLFVITYVCGVQSFVEFQGSDMLKWERSEPGWSLRVASVTSEWTMAVLLDIYILSFVLDFRRVCIQGPKVTFTDI